MDIEGTLVDRQAIGIGIAPVEARANPFVRAFADCLRQEGFPVTDYAYSPVIAPDTRVLILHWPNDFFLDHTPARIRQLEDVLDSWNAARKSGRLRVCWVAHDVHPYDCPSCNPVLTRRFLESLDGRIYLSSCSRQVIHETYPFRVQHELVTTHGDYRQQFTTPPRPTPPAEPPIRLGFFGRIRPYKNIEALIHAVGALPSDAVRLRITGFRLDPHYSDEIERLAGRHRNVELDARSEFIPEEELERAIDSCHGIVLPYRSILNSGSVLLALSRNRPVLAPATGSLPEVQAGVGPRWLRLYEGDIRPDVVESLVTDLRRPPEGTCDLGAHDWGAIGRALAGFVERMCHDRATH